MKLNIDYWLLQTLAMMLTAFLLPGVRVSGFLGALCSVICLAFFNAHLWDAALFFRIPNTFTFQSILLLLTNGVLFWVFAKIVPGIEVRGLLPAIIAPAIFTFLSLFIDRTFDNIDWIRYWNAGRFFLLDLQGAFSGA